MSPPLSPVAASPVRSTHTLDPRGNTLGSTAITLPPSVKSIPVAEIPEQPVQSGPYPVDSIVILSPEGSSDLDESFDESDELEESDDFDESDELEESDDLDESEEESFEEGLFGAFSSFFSFVPMAITSSLLSFFTFLSVCSRFTSSPFSYVTSNVLTTFPLLPPSFTFSFPFSTESSSFSTVSYDSVSTSFSVSLPT